MIRWLVALVRGHDGPPAVPPAPEVADIAPLLADLDAARRQLTAERKADERHAVQHRREQAALRREIRRGNFLTDRLRGTHGGR